MTRPSVPEHLLPQSTTTQLLTLARAGLADAARTRSDGLRYAGAHLAAHRAATAVLVARATPTRGRGRSLTSVWIALPQVAPEFAEWAVCFADGAPKRAAVEAGLSRVVTAQEADGLLRSAETFVNAVEQAVGQYRWLQDMADGHLNLHASVRWYNDGAKLDEPELLYVGHDRPDIADPDWWQALLADGLIALPEADGGTRCTVTLDGHRAIAAYRREVSHG